MASFVSPAGSFRRLALAVRARAEALGFDAVGIAAATPPLQQDHERYRAFLEEGMHGEMEYLAASPEVRARVDTSDILEGARSVVCLARRYQRPVGEEAQDPPFARRIARYARGRDYHNGLRKKLRQLARFVRGLGPEVRARPLCDDAPVLERAWAARAGLGFVGKNGMLIVPGQGSFVLLGEVVTTLELEPDAPVPGRCGECTACLDACPTGALVRPFVLDARRCVSYLTIELRGPVPESQRAGVGEHLFGCDDCQTVCPFNRSERPRAGATAAFAPHARWAETSLEDLLAPDLSARWPELAQGSPLHRATPEGLARNAAIILGNTGQGEEALRTAAASHPSPVVRDAAAWSLSRPRPPR